MNRRHFVRLAGAAALSAPAFAARADIPFFEPTGMQDFDELWRTISERYCYFGQKATDWDQVRALYRPQAMHVSSIDEFRDIIRRTLNELYDRHTGVDWSPDGGPHAPYLDLRVEPQGDSAIVLDVREGSAAAQAGLGSGAELLKIDGVALDVAAAEHRPQCLSRPDPAAETYAYNAAVSGRRERPRRLAVRDGKRTREFVVEPAAAMPDETPALCHERLDGGLGYIRIASFADMTAIERFDAALEALRDAPGLIIDVRRNGGGDTTVAVPIMGRFIGEPKLYAYMRRREGAGLSERWREEVEPRGPFTYTDPVVVLTDFWSASLAEGFPMGMRGMARARVVGRPMMQLGAGVWRFCLDRTGVEGQYSAEPVYDVHDRPRDAFLPDIVTEPGADILEAGIKELRRLIG